jgi:hypothetical protein
MSLLVPGSGLNVSFARGERGGIAILIKMTWRPTTGRCGDWDGSAYNDNAYWMSFGPLKDDGDPRGHPQADEDLFKMKSLGMLGVSNSSDGGEGSDDLGDANCSQELRSQAEKACEHIPEEHLRKDCVFDVCVMKDLSMANASDAFEILEVEEGKGVPILEGNGRCLDSQNRSYSSLDVPGASSEMACMEALRAAAAVPEVRGAQLREGAVCEILADPDVDMGKAEGPRLSWGTSGARGLGQGIVGTSSGDEEWTCWKVN